MKFAPNSARDWAKAVQFTSASLLLASMIDLHPPIGAQSFSYPVRVNSRLKLSGLFERKPIAADLFEHPAGGGRSRSHFAFGVRIVSKHINLVRHG